MFNFLKKRKEIAADSNNNHTDICFCEKHDFNNKTFYICSSSKAQIKDPDVYLFPFSNTYHTTNIEKSRCYIDGEKCSKFEKMKASDIFAWADAEAYCFIEVECDEKADPESLDNDVSRAFYVLSPNITASEFPSDIFYNYDRHVLYTTDIEKSRCYMDEGREYAILEKVRAEPGWPLASIDEHGPQIAEGFCMMELESESFTKLRNTSLALVHASREDLLKAMLNSKTTKATMVDTMGNVVRNLDRLTHIISEGSDNYHEDERHEDKWQ